MQPMSIYAFIFTVLTGNRKLRVLVIVGEHVLVCAFVCVCVCVCVRVCVGALWAGVPVAVIDVSEPACGFC